MKRSAVLMTMLAACIPLTGCVMVGYSSRGGFFVWQLRVPADWPAAVAAVSQPLIKAKDRS